MNFFRAISDILRFDRTNWKALALCFFTAAVFWIFNALNKNYATNLRFPLQFEFDNSKFIAVEPLPSDLILNVSGNGWEILRKSLGLKVPSILMPLERPSDIHKIVASTLSPIVASQIGALQVNYVVTDTLRLAIAPKLSKKIKLLPNVSHATFKNNYGRTSPIVILPDSVTLDGPKNIIEKLSNTLTIDVMASRISSNFRENVEVVVSDNTLISRNPPVVQVIFEVGPIEEIIRQVRLEILKTSVGIQSDRDSVRCVFTVPQKEHERFSQESVNFSASLILTELRKGETRSFLPTLKGLPVYAELNSIDSVLVKKR